MLFTLQKAGSSGFTENLTTLIYKPRIDLEDTLRDVHLLTNGRSDWAQLGGSAQGHICALYHGHKQPGHDRARAATWRTVLQAWLFMHKLAHVVAVQRAPASTACFASEVTSLRPVPALPL